MSSLLPSVVVLATVSMFCLYLAWDFHDRYNRVGAGVLGVLGLSGLGFAAFALIGGTA